MTLQDHHDGRRWFHGLLLLVALPLWLRVWLGPVALLDRAEAQIPDAGRQRQLLVEEARRTNELLTEIKDLLHKRTFNVRLEGADNQADAPPDPHGPGRGDQRPE